METTEIRFNRKNSLNSRLVNTSLKNQINKLPQRNWRELILIGEKNIIKNFFTIGAVNDNPSSLFTLMENKDKLSSKTIDSTVLAKLEVDSIKQKTRSIEKTKIIVQLSYQLIGFPDNVKNYDEIKQNISTSFIVNKITCGIVTRSESVKSFEQAVKLFNNYKNTITDTYNKISSYEYQILQ